MSRPFPPRRAAAVAVAVATALAVALLAFAQAGLQRSFERRWSHRRLESVLYVPSGRDLGIFSLGFRAFVADVLWMKAIGYYGGHALTDQAYPWLSHMIDRITTLDPQFRIPYYFGGITLAVAEEHAGESVGILEKAMTRYPGDWRFPFYAGFVHFYHFQDPGRAAEYMQVAASLPGAPPYVPRLAASLAAESGRVDTAIRFLEAMYQGTADEHMRAAIAHKIDDLRIGRVPEGLRRFLAGERVP